MAKSSDEIERELELKRQQLHARVDKLRERVAGDLRGMRQETQEQLDSYKAKAKGYVQKAEGTASEHPWLTLAGGFGSGVALGVTGPALGGGGHKRAPSHNGESSGSSGESLLSKGLGAVVSMAGGPVVDEVRGTLQESLSEIKSNLQESVSDLVHGITGNGATSSNGTQHRQKVRDHIAA